MYKLFALKIVLYQKQFNSTSNYEGLTFKCLLFQLDFKQDSAGRMILVIILDIIFYENSSCVNRTDRKTDRQAC
jgi:hypothetical protein